jgi:hypothetical protein
MPIAKKPSTKSQAAQPVDEQQIEQFIGGAGKTSVIEAPVDTKKKPTPIRFDPEMYDRIDKAAKRRGQSRAAWVRYVVSQALEAEESR